MTRAPAVAARSGRSVAPAAAPWSLRRRGECPPVLRLASRGGLGSAERAPPWVSRRSVQLPSLLIGDREIRLLAIVDRSPDLSELRAELATLSPQPFQLGWRQGTRSEGGSRPPLL